MRINITYSFLSFYATNADFPGPIPEEKDPYLIIPLLALPYELPLICMGIAPPLISGSLTSAIN